MGMYARLSHIPAEKLEAIRKNPTAFYKKNFEKPDGPDPAFAAARDVLRKNDLYKKMQAAMAAMPELQKAEELAKQGRVLSPEEMLASTRKLIEAVPELNQLRDVMNKATDAAPTRKPEAAVRKRPKGAGLDKSWHCLHFVIAGHPTETGTSAAGMAILGGTEIPDKARVMGNGPVRCLTAEQVKATSEALEQFPIEEQLRQFKQDQAQAAQIYCPNFAPDELQHYFQVLKSYYQEAADQGHGMLLWIE